MRLLFRRRALDSVSVRSVPASLPRFSPRSEGRACAHCACGLVHALEMPATVRSVETSAATLPMHVRFVPASGHTRAVSRYVCFVPILLQKSPKKKAAVGAEL